MKNTSNYIFIHNQLLVRLMEIRELEARKDSLALLIRSCDANWERSVDDLKRSYQRSLSICKQNIDNEWREYTRLLDLLQEGPVRKAVRKILPFFFEEDALTTYHRNTCGGKN